jgi:hypothetical protein
VEALAARYTEEDGERIVMLLPVSISDEGGGGRGCGGVDGGGCRRDYAFSIKARGCGRCVGDNRCCSWSACSACPSDLSDAAKSCRVLGIVGGCSKEGAVLVVKRNESFRIVRLLVIRDSVALRLLERAVLSAVAKPSQAAPLLPPR